MREIKFRVFDKLEQKYIYDPVELELLFLELNITVSKSVIGFAPEYFERFVFEQYTGLKDRNGVEIYEGDVVRAESHSPSDYVIEFIEGGYCATHKDLEGYPIDLNHFYPSIGCQIEVIGNIHTKTDSNVQP